MLSSLLDKETKETEKSFKEDDRIPNSVVRDALPSFPNDQMILFWYSTPLQKSYIPLSGMNRMITIMVNKEKRYTHWSLPQIIHLWTNTISFFKDTVDINK